MSTKYEKDGSAESLRYLAGRLKEHDEDGWASYAEVAADRMDVLEAALRKIAGNNPHNITWWCEEARAALQGSAPLKDQP